MPSAAAKRVAPPLILLLVLLASGGGYVEQGAAAAAALLFPAAAAGTSTKGLHGRATNNRRWGIIIVPKSESSPVSVPKASSSSSEIVTVLEDGATPVVVGSPPVGVGSSQSVEGDVLSGAVPDVAKMEKTTAAVPEENVSPPPPFDDAARRPGMEENSRFDCDGTVEFWRDFQIDGFASAESNAAELARVAVGFASLGPDGLDFWLRHVVRSGYFMANALIGTTAFQLHETLVNGGDAPTPSSQLPIPTDPRVASRLVLEAALSYRQDYDRIRGGAYDKPWDVMTPNHRQSSPLNVALQTARFAREAVDVMGRRKRGSEVDKRVWILDDDDHAAPGLYPEYYRTAFHFQSDGWMSKRSADVYETSTETLFLGRQDAMQRTALKHIVGMDPTTRPKKVLEVACGTGRFLTFVRDNLPLDAECTAVDLSPYYLEVARDNDSYWRRTRETEERRRKGRNDVSIAPARFVQARAENLPFDDGTFDAVVCVYLFHELPRTVRARVAAEMARVVRQGGVVVFTDSIQRGDRPILDDALANFSNMNEPHYADYIADDIPIHFVRAGLRCRGKTLCSTTKTLSFTKPETADLSS